MVSVLQSDCCAEGKKRKRHSVAQVKGNWQSNDDEKLTRLVQEKGEGSWSLIAQSFPGRIGKQCRERWNNQLRPDIRRDSWTHAEEVLLVAAHQDVGNRWAEIAKNIPGRTENAVKNHWNATLRKSAKRTNTATPGGLAHYMRSNSMQHGSSRRSTITIEQARTVSKQQAGPSIASTSSNTFSATCSDENNDPACSGDGADSNCKNASRFHSASVSLRKPPVRQSHSSSRACKGSQYDSDSDFSTEYTPSQHASRSRRYTTRAQKHKQAAATVPAPEPDLASNTLRPRTASLHSSTEAPLLPQPTGGHPGQAALLASASHRLCMPQRQRIGDPRLDSMMQDKFAAVTSTKAEEEMLLKSLQDLLPDELVNAELSDMDAFCLDSALLDAAAPAQQGPASNFRPGASEGASGVLQAHTQVFQYSEKPSDPRLVRPGLHGHNQRQLVRSAQHASDPRQRISAAVDTSNPTGSTLPPSIKIEVAAVRQSGSDEEMGQHGLQQHQLPAVARTNTSSASSSSNVVGTVASDSIGERQQSLAQACAVVHGYASQRSVQSSDSIHIQVEPLHSMDSYAAKLMSPGLEVAIYSGRCPLTMLATYHPAPQLVQHQALTNLHKVCGWVRASSRYQVGSLLIAVRAGHVPPGVPGLVIAASAPDRTLALQGVQAAVKQVEALGAHTKNTPCL